MKYELEEAILERIVREGQPVVGKVLARYNYFFLGYEDDALVFEKNNNRYYFIEDEYLTLSMFIRNYTNSQKEFTYTQDGINWGEMSG